jgi:hypothetical protein
VTAKGGLTVDGRDFQRLLQSDPLMPAGIQDGLARSVADLQRANLLA